MATITQIVLLAVAAYALFFAYDVRTVSSAANARSGLLFAAGCVFVLASLIVIFATQFAACPWDVLSILCLIIALIAAALTIKALFFSLPANTYAAPEQGRPAYTKGMYALCRHPGVLWLCVALVAVAVMLRTPAAVVGCLVLCAGDVAYMLFQDRWSFPRTFCDYEAYKRSTPLILPTAASVRRAFETGCAAQAGGRV